MSASKRGRHLCGLLVSGMLTAAYAGPAAAVEYNFGEATLSIDSIASVGMTMRVSKQDCMYIAVVNGGCPDGIGQSANINTDDGNINFDQWDIVSAPVKVVSDAELRWKNFGAFVRAKAYYDYIVHEEAGTNSTDYGVRPLTDALRGDDARNAARGVDLLDAFVFADFDVGSVPTSVRFGKQVINWGESLAIQGGINQFNAIDVAAIRLPGSELKEALTPEESIYVNVVLPANLSFEAFYAFNWRQTELDPVSTFFSGADIVGPGGAYVNTVIPEQPNPNTAATLYRAPSDEPDDQGQFGTKLGYWAGWLNGGTELGLYYVNYHSKAPFIEYSNGFPPAIAGLVGGLAGGFPAQYYRTAFPEDIEYVGTSFATTVAGTAVAGEVLYSWNTPFQISSSEILGARWIDNSSGGLAGATVLPYDMTPGAFPAGYFREDVITGQVSTITILNPSNAVPKFFRSDLAILIVNAGFQYLPSISDARLSVLSGGRGSEISHPNPLVQGALFNVNQELIHADTFSSGYRVIAGLDYNNVLNTPWKLSPNIQWQHDLGTSAGSIGPGFLQDRMTASVGVTANLQNVWQAELRYTNSFGNKFQNYTQDRDFVSFSVSYAF
ncbi:protein of unknown function DUF1302 [Parvibaculum lavamentivorans DS-1]|uniref:DUF1302 domain-containing protein n=1 Tax=Parvibaculum lavamentivorans (strain DS-1 / DSM 13023 / NCIMB 13966) TaxID=402881 RepID=A7HQA6_PARL1|nr:DUF1302 domain-containing protein [Parvibaculum lavamentivorans]ABS62089.1 protein of unknown function DUF1302 [Parvibaculum lavamentivorans DS-1]